jgi:hypothetical protein
LPRVWLLTAFMRPPGGPQTPGVDVSGGLRRADIIRRRLGDGGWSVSARSRLLDLQRQAEIAAQLFRRYQA